MHTLTTTAKDILVEQFVVLLKGGSSFEGEMKYRPPHKRIYQDLFLSVHIPDESKGNLSYVFMTLQDITNWKKIERQLRKKAHVDGLTKLFNQDAIVERLENELVRAKRYGLDLSCMMIDVDFFKVINDKFGHQKVTRFLKVLQR